MSKFYLISFRSRNLLMIAGNELRNNRIPYTVVSTPRGLGSVCTMSIKIESKYYSDAIRIIRLRGIVDYTTFDLSRLNIRVY